MIKYTNYIYLMIELLNMSIESLGWRIGSDSPVGGDQTRIETCDRYVIEVPDTEESIDPCQLPLRKYEQV